MRPARLVLAALTTLACIGASLCLDPRLASAIPSAFSPITALASTPVLLRYPYLTDVTQSWAMVSLATDTLSAAPGGKWGPAAGNCASPPNSVAATFVISFGSTDKQFKAELTGLQPNAAYCYRVLQAGVDLLGSAPVFTSALASGATDPFTFAVIGDWGAGTTDENKVLTQIAAAAPNFIISAGDNAYNSGTQTDYGDINGGNVFAPMYWPLVGKTTPAFMIEGNHGFTGNLPYFQNWPQDSTVAACAQNGCRYQPDTYCCTGTLGSTSHSYPSSWYAFDWGNSRFYVLEGAWGDSTGAYLGDFQGHFNGPVVGCPICGTELTWLANDLANHTAAHKFAFWHYPLYSDSSTQPSDTYLDGSTNLEGALASNGVNIVFNGHAHDYERNYPQIAGSPMLSYVTGGGGAALGSVSRHGSFDAYARAVYHYLKVTVNGSSVTVTPVDENGATFDVQTYTFPPQSLTGNDFAISVNPGSVSVVQGQSVSSTISTAVTSGSAQTITLTAGGLPSGATASFNPSTVTAGGSSTLTISTAASTPGGTYTVTVTGTGASATHSTSVSLTVTVPDDFSISASPDSVCVVVSQTVRSTISTAVTSGNAQAITLSAIFPYTTLFRSFNPSTVTAGGSSTLTISTAASTPSGTYTVTVTGTGASATHSTSVSLTVTLPDDFSISASPNSVSVVQGQSGTSTISTTVTSGSAQTLTLSASGLPSGATASFNPSSVTAGGSSTLTLSTTSSTPGGSYTVTVTGTDRTSVV